MTGYREYRRVAHNMIDHDTENMSDTEKQKFYREVVHLLAHQYPNSEEAIDMIENELENTVQSENVDVPTTESVSNKGYW